MTSFHFSSKVLNFIDTRPKATELKGAVKMDPNLMEYLQIEGLNFPSTLYGQSIGLNTTIFATFDRQDQSLTDFVAQLCKQFGIELNSFNNESISKHLALIFDDRINFVTETNKNLINQGFILILTVSPSIYATYFFEKLSSLTTEQLSLFSSLCQDPVFIENFYNLKGIQRLTKIIEETDNLHSLINLSLLNILLQLMQSFPQLFPWSDLSSQFVRKISFFVNGQAKLEQNETRALALEMLLIISEHCEHLNECLKSEIPVDLLIRHLDNSNERVMLGSISLIGSIYVLADREERINIVKLLHERPFISAIGRVLNREEEKQNNDETLTSFKSKLYEQLARLQHIRFDEISALALRTPTEKEIDFLKAIGNEFGFIETSNNTTLSTDFYDQKIIQQQEDDWLTLKEMVQKTPPGLLAIFAIIDLTHTKQLSSPCGNQLGEETLNPSNIALNKLKELNTHFIMRPTILPQILFHLASILVEILGICSESSSVVRRFGLSKVSRFFRLVLQCERPFLELFRILVELFCRTWNDMNAKLDEINKVYNAVQDQFERSLFENPNSLELFEKEMLRKKFSYFNMQKIWKREQLEQEELELNSENIQPLKDHLRPEIENLAIRRRISLLKKGMIFHRILPSKPIKENSMLALPSSVSVHNSPVHSSGLLNSPQHQQQQYWFWCLDENEKFLCFCNCNLNSAKQTTKLEMEKKLLISDIKNILIGQELISHLNQQHGSGKLYKKSQNILRCGIFIECNNNNNSSTEFLLCAQNEQEFSDWYEAINCLCWPQKSLKNNKNIQKEVDQLLNLQINIRLIDVPKLEEKLKIVDLCTDFSWI